MESIAPQYDSIKAFQRLQEVKAHFTKMKVIITFYGNTNVGKSTLLNGIMGNK